MGRVDCVETQDLASLRRETKCDPGYPLEASVRPGSIKKACALGIEMEIPHRGCMPPEGTQICVPYHGITKCDCKNQFREELQWIARPCVGANLVFAHMQGNAQRKKRVDPLMMEA